MRRLFAALAVLALFVAACGGGDSGDGAAPATEAPANVPVGDATAGTEIYAGTCVACHGPDATGLPNLGRDLTSNAFIISQTETELVAFLEVGRPSDHPENEAGIQMPPKGGNPSLSEQDLYDVAAYLKDLPGN